MKPHASLALFFLLASFSAIGLAEIEDPEVGRICVAPLSDRAIELDHDYADVKAPREYTYEFSVQFDDDEPLSVPRDRPKLVVLAGTEKPHRVRIRDGQTQIESFSFTFAKRGRNLCLSYTGWYQTWQLDPPRPKATWCKCPAKGE